MEDITFTLNSLVALMLQTPRGRLAEVEAECVLLRRENGELKAGTQGSEETLEILQRENAILRRDCAELTSELDKMRGTLLSVNRTIYGERAAEMCKDVALGGTQRQALTNVENSKAVVGNKKKRNKKPFRPPGVNSKLKN